MKNGTPSDVTMLLAKHRPASPEEATAAHEFAAVARHLGAPSFRLPDRQVA